MIKLDFPSEDIFFRNHYNMNSKIENVVFDIEHSSVPFSRVFNDLSDFMTAYQHECEKGTIYGENGRQLVLGSVEPSSFKYIPVKDISSLLLIKYKYTRSFLNKAQKVVDCAFHGDLFKKLNPYLKKVRKISRLMRKNHIAYQVKYGHRRDTPAYKKNQDKVNNCSFIKCSLKGLLGSLKAFENSFPYQDFSPRDGFYIRVSTDYRLASRAGMGSFTPPFLIKGHTLYVKLPYGDINYLYNCIYNSYEISSIYRNFFMRNYIGYKSEYTYAEHNSKRIAKRKHTSAKQIRKIAKHVFNNKVSALIIYINKIDLKTDMKSIPLPTFCQKYGIKMNLGRDDYSIRKHLTA